MRSAKAPSASGPAGYRAMSSLNAASAAGVSPLRRASTPRSKRSFWAVRSDDRRRSVDGSVVRGATLGTPLGAAALLSDRCGLELARDGDDAADAEAVLVTPQPDGQVSPGTIRASLVAVRTETTPS